MTQVSLTGYFVGGMFLNLAYWDMPYFLMIALVVTWHVVRSRSPEPANPTAMRPDAECLRYPADRLRFAESSAFASRPSSESVPDANQKHKTVRRPTSFMTGLNRMI
jgi:hypothetical protein